MDRVDDLKVEFRADIKEIKDDVKCIRTEVTNLTSVTNRNSEILNEHMRRTEANEKRVEIMEKVAVSWDTGMKVTLRILGILASGIIFFEKVLPMIKDVLLK